MSENKKIHLPNRAYYPLELVAEMADCRVQDLFHYAANARLEICVRLKAENVKNAPILAFAPSWITDAPVNVHSWGENDEPVFMVHIRPQSHDGFIRITRYSGHLVVAEDFDTYFSMYSNMLKELEFAGDIVEIPPKNLYITLPKGERYTAMVMQGVDNLELDHELMRDIDEDEQGNLFFIVKAQKPIQISRLVITHAELERFMREKHVMEQIPCSDVSKWPWGIYETKHLRIMADAIQRFWVNYDPEEPDTAPTNEDVTKWLKAKGVTNNIASRIATIIRADDLPVGVRRR